MKKEYTKPTEGEILLEQAYEQIKKEVFSDRFTGSYKENLILEITKLNHVITNVALQRIMQDGGKNGKNARYYHLRRRQTYK